MRISGPLWDTAVSAQNKNLVHTFGIGFKTVLEVSPHGIPVILVSLIVVVVVVVVVSISDYSKPDSRQPPSKGDR
jgi:hypothetical protein